MTDNRAEEMYRVYKEYRYSIGQTVLPFSRFNQRMWQASKKYTGPDGSIEGGDLQKAFRQVCNLP